MLYEIRLYAVQPGRMPDIERRMLADVPPLFAEHGVRAVAHWSVLAGPDLPAFVYLLEWQDAAQRDACWERFYADARWWELRRRTNAGSEMVESYGLWLMKPNAAWHPPFEPLVPAVAGEVHEMLLYAVAIGQGPAVAACLRAAVLPAIAQAGGRTLAVLNMAAGPRIPAVAVLVAWPGFGQREQGQHRLQRLHAADACASAALLGRRDAYLLRPITPAMAGASHEEEATCPT